MSGASDRRSDRVEVRRPIPAGQQDSGRTTGPESRTADGRVVAPAPEGIGRVSRGRLNRLAGELSDRESAVLRSVGEYGFLTTRHLQLLHFYDHATQQAAARICRRVLSRLATDRIIEPLERRIGGLRAGSASYVWRVGPAGDRLLRLSDPDAPRARRKEPSLHFLDHRLAVADVACQLTVSSRSGLLELLRVVPEPSSWRRFTGSYASREILKPDLFAVTAIGDYEDHWFIEVDRATESLPTLLNQCAQYERYRQNGAEQTQSGLFPRVLWLVPDRHRVERLGTAIARRSDLDDELFRVNTYTELLDTISNHETKGGDHA
ncbi:MAG: hypothetical protein JWO32_3114 [Bacteroidetes bacterium]|nr:hypothetical protein [Bacteroidota bacterium]